VEVCIDHQGLNQVAGDGGSVDRLVFRVLKVMNRDLVVSEVVSVYTEFRLNFVKIYWLTIILVSHLSDGESRSEDSVFVNILCLLYTRLSVAEELSAILADEFNFNLVRVGVDETKSCHL
jgi:hypothetical protein